MHELRLSRIPVGWFLLLSSALVAAGVWAEWHTQGKNGVDSLPLAWLFVLVCAPAFSIGCLIAFCWRANRSPWLVVLATLITLPQCIVWFFSVGAVLHYLGVIR